MNSDCAGLASRRLAGTHDPVDLEQRLLVALDLVGLERVADIAAGADVVDVEQVQLGIAGFLQRLQQLLVESRRPPRHGSSPVLGSTSSSARYCP